jgi:hypothetical protein
MMMLVASWVTTLCGDYFEPYELKDNLINVNVSDEGRKESAREVGKVTREWTSDKKRRSN